MDGQIKLMMGLLRSAVCEQKIEPEIAAQITEERLEGIYQLAKAHDISHLICYALQQNELLPNSALGTKFYDDFVMTVYRYEQQNFELTQVRRVFEQAELPYMPLKGAVIRAFYPAAWMRTSCDIDILVRKSDLERATMLLKKKLRYVSNFYGKHDISFYTPTGVHVEIHYTLLEDGRLQSAERILPKVWQMSHPIRGCEYVMRDEMFYFYIITHMAKHVQTGGCGVRALLDLWLLNKEKSHDPEKRAALLEQGGLTRFARVAEATCKMWFDDGKRTEATTLFEEFLLRAGIYGNMNSNALVRQFIEMQNKTSLHRKIWKSYDELKYWYPSLEKCRLLLPFYQVRRWLYILFGGAMGRMVRKKYRPPKCSPVELDRTRRLLNELGIANKEK